MTTTADEIITVTRRPEKRMVNAYVETRVAAVLRNRAVEIITDIVMVSNGNGTKKAEKVET